MMRRLACAACLVALAALGATGARGETREVRIGIQFGAGYLPIVVAEAEGFIVEEARRRGVDPLKVSIHRFSGSTAVNEALLSDSVDLAAYGVPGLLIAWEKTRGRQSIKGLLGLSLTLYTLATNKPGIRTLADFGAEDRIAVTALNSPQALMLRMAAEALWGVGQSARIERLMVSLPHPDATAALLAGSAIAGYFSTPPFSQALLKDRRIHAVLTSRQIFGGEDVTGAALGGLQKFVDANPKVAEAVLAGVERGMKLIAGDPARAAAIYLKSESSSLSVAEVQALLQDGSTDYHIEPRGIMTYVDFMARIGMMKVKPAAWTEVFFSFVHQRSGS